MPEASANRTISVSIVHEPMHPAGQTASGAANTEWYFLRKVALEIDEDYTMTIVRLELPDITAQAAQAAGLLTPQAIDSLLTEALRKHDAGGY